MKFIDFNLEQIIDADLLIIKLFFPVVDMFFPNKLCMDLLF